MAGRLLRTVRKKFFAVNPRKKGFRRHKTFRAPRAPIAATASARRKENEAYNDAVREARAMSEKGLEVGLTISLGTTVVRYTVWIK